MAKVVAEEDDVVEMDDAAGTNEMPDDTPAVVDCVKLGGLVVTAPPTGTIDPPPPEAERDDVETGLGSDGDVPFGCFELEVGMDAGWVPVIEDEAGLEIEAMGSKRSQHEFH